MAKGQMMVDEILAAAEILKEMLPKDFEYSWRDLSHMSKGPRSVLLIKAYARVTSTLIRPQYLNFEIFIFNGLLVAQRMSDHSSIVSRVDVPLANPACFDRIYDYFTRACVL